MYKFEGEGTVENPYLLQNSEDLKMFTAYVSAGFYTKAHFALVNDIDMKDVEYNPAVRFEGVLDGKGHKIVILTINKLSTNQVALIALLNKGTIKNLGIIDSTMNGKGDTGGLAGFGTNSTIRNRYSNAIVNTTGTCGGIVGYLAETIENVYSIATISSTANSGVIVGFAEPDVAQINLDYLYFKNQ